MKENNKYKRPSINKAITENTIYKGYRWLFVDRELDQNIITHIEPTKKQRSKIMDILQKLIKNKQKLLIFI